MFRRLASTTHVTTPLRVAVPWMSGLQSTASRTQALLPSPAGPLQHRRAFICFTRVCRDAETTTGAKPLVDPPLSGAAAPEGQQGSAEADSALDVAMRVNKLKRVHQTGGGGANKPQIEQEAWVALNSLTEEQINNAEGKAVALLLNSWAYFAKFWANGKDGPAKTDSA